MPDYDGRGAEPTTVGDVAIWIPRVLVSPLYLVSEYVLRRPLAWFLTQAERNNWPALVVDLFRFGEQRNVGVFPTALVDFGFRPSAGLYGYWKNFLAPHNRLRLRAAIGGLDWLTVALSDRYAAGERASFAISGAYSKRPDWIFHGIGPHAGTRRARYSARQIEIEANSEVTFSATGSFRLAIGFRDVGFSNSQCCDGVGINERVAAGELELPPGFADGYAVARQQASVGLGPMPVRPNVRWGTRLEASVEHVFELNRALSNRWLHVSGAWVGFVDLDGAHRIVSLTVDASTVHALEGQPVPFTELPRLGGSRSMAAFLDGRLLGQSALAATLEYRWPLWVWLDGTMHAAVGNVFAKENLRDFELDLLRASLGVGLRSVSDSGQTFNLLLAWGTEPFADGGNFTDFRFLLGAARAF